MSTFIHIENISYAVFSLYKQHTYHINKYNEINIYVKSSTIEQKNRLQKSKTAKIKHVLTLIIYIKNSSVEYFYKIQYKQHNTCVMSLLMTS